MKTGNAIKGFYSTNLGFYDVPQGIPNAKGLVISRGAMKIEKELLTCIKGSRFGSGATANLCLIAKLPGRQSDIGRKDEAQEIKDSNPTCLLRCFHRPCPSGVITQGRGEIDIGK